MIDKKKYLISFVFILVFLFSRTLYSIISADNINYLYYTLLLSYFIFYLNISNKIIYKKFKEPVFLTLVFVCFGLFNFIATSEMNFFRFIGPISALIGYIFYETYKFKFDSRAFIGFFIFLYIYFFFEYYLNLPDLFARVKFDEDAYIFDNSSSNAIPLSLNLLTCFFLLFNLNSPKFTLNKTILFIAVINIILILIQQSRLGIIVSILILIILMSTSGFKDSKIIKLTILVLVILSIYYLTNTFIEIWNSSGFEKLLDKTQNVRYLINLEFYNNLEFSELIFGKKKTSFYVVGGIDQYSTFNLFSEIIRMYGIFPLITLLFFFFKRFKNRNYYKNNAICLVILIYALNESIFIANLSDVILYVALFTKNDLPSYS